MINGSGPRLIRRLYVFTTLKASLLAWSWIFIVLLSFVRLVWETISSWERRMTAFYGSYSCPATVSIAIRLLADVLETFSTRRDFSPIRGFATSISLNYTLWYKWEATPTPNFNQFSNCNSVHRHSTVQRYACKNTVDRPRYEHATFWIASG